MLPGCQGAEWWGVRCWESGVPVAGAGLQGCRRVAGAGGCRMSRGGRRVPGVTRRAGGWPKGGWPKGGRLDSQEARELFADALELNQESIVAEGAVESRCQVAVETARRMLSNHVLTCKCEEAIARNAKYESG